MVPEAGAERGRSAGARDRVDGTGTDRDESGVRECNRPRSDGRRRGSIDRLMRLKLNLASQPYAEVRRFIARWTLLLALMIVVSGVLVYFASLSLRTWYSARSEEAKVQTKMVEADQIRANAQSYLNQPQNRDTRDRSQFLNELIARKAFSWTQVFSDLEKLMPVGLHVVSVTPAVNENSQIEVKMTVNGRSPERAIELVKRLEDSKHFTSAQIIDSKYAAEGGPGNGPRAGVQPGDVTQFQISAVYVPGSENRGGKP